MKLSLSEADLSAFVARQLTNLLPDTEISGDQLLLYVQRAIERAEHCFSRVSDKYYSKGDQTRFNHLHTDQYASFLYLLGNTIFCMDGDLSIATKTYVLNKALHGIDVYFEVELPDVFFFQHPIGTILGRARYSDFFAVFQGCTVGGNPEEEYPRLGKGVVMYGGSAIIGTCTVGHNCWLSMDAVVMNEDLPPNSAIFGRSPDLVRKPTDRSVLSYFFRTGGEPTVD